MKFLGNQSIQKQLNQLLDKKLKLVTLIRSVNGVTTEIHGFQDEQGKLLVSIEVPVNDVIERKAEIENFKTQVQAQLSAQTTALNAEVAKLDIQIADIQNPPVSNLGPA